MISLEQLVAVSELGETREQDATDNFSFSESERASGRRDCSVQGVGLRFHHASQGETFGGHLQKPALLQTRIGARSRSR